MDGIAEPTRRLRRGDRPEPALTAAAARDALEQLALAVHELLAAVYSVDAQCVGNATPLARTGIRHELDYVDRQLARLFEQEGPSAPQTAQIKALRHWMEAHEALQGAEQELLVGELRAAARLVDASEAELRALRAAGTHTDEEVALMDAMAAASVAQRAAVVAAAQRCVALSALILRPGPNRDNVGVLLRVRRAAMGAIVGVEGAPTLEQAWLALHRAGRLARPFSQFLLTLTSALVVPACRRAAAVRLSRHETRAVAELRVQRVSPLDNPNPLAWTAHLSEIVAFTCAHILVPLRPDPENPQDADDRRETRAAQLVLFPEHFWAPVWRVVRDELLLPQLEANAARLEQFHGEMAILLDLQAELRAAGAISASCADLSAFYHDAPSLCAQRLATVHLEFVRERLLDPAPSVERVSAQSERRGGRTALLPDRHSSANLENHGTGTSKKKGSAALCGDFFVLNSQGVSAQIRAVVERLYAILDAPETQTSPQCAQNAYRTVRDALALAFALLPLRLGALEKTDPVVKSSDAIAVMLYHNDCQYVAYHLVTMLHGFRERLPPPQRQSATLLDHLEAFRASGEAALASYVDSVQVRVFTNLPAPPLRYADYRRAEHVRSQALTALATAWRDLAPEPLYASVMGTLVSSALEPLLNLGNIADSSSAHERRMLVHTLRALKRTSEQTLNVAAPASPDADILDENALTWQTAVERVRNPGGSQNPGLSGSGAEAWSRLQALLGSLDDHL